MVYRRGRGEPEQPETFPRGTRDISRKAWEAQQQVKASQKIPLRDDVITAELELQHRIELVLREACLSTAELAKTIREPVGKVADALRTMHEEQLLANIGSDSHPRWCFRIGDHCSALELRGMVKRLLRERRMSTQELSRATGARRSRVSRAIVVIRQDESLDAVVRLHAEIAGNARNR